MSKMTETNVREQEFPQEQTDAQMLAHEGEIIAGLKEDSKPYAESEAQQTQAFGSLIQGMLEAAKFQATTFKNIEIARGGVVYFAFRIRPLTEKEYEHCKEKSTKYVRNKQLGMRLPESSNNVKYRALLIYKATDAEDRKKTWDNHQLWDALLAQGFDIATGTDVINTVLMPGEKSALIEEIDKLSGFHNENLEIVDGPEDTVKN